MESPTGPPHGACLTLDAALDLQFRLAGFLAEAELAEYAEDTDEGFAESKQNLVLLSHGSRARKFDA